MMSTSSRPLIRGKRLPGGRLTHQSQSRLQFARVLLQALAVEGVTPHQVIAQGGSSSATPKHTDVIHVSMIVRLHIPHRVSSTRSRRAPPFGRRQRARRPTPRPPALAADPDRSTLADWVGAAYELLDQLLPWRLGSGLAG